MAGTFDPPETEDDQTRVCGRGPVATFADYPTTLKALTRGEGGMTCFSDGYDLCHDADRVIEQAGYRAEGDLEQPVSSVFCSAVMNFRHSELCAAAAASNWKQNSASREAKRAGGVRQRSR